MSKIFVAGAAGNIGKEVVAALRERDIPVVAGVHGNNPAQNLVELGAEVRGFDFEDQDAMTAAMTGCERLFLVLPLTERMARFGHLAVEAAKAAGIQYLVRSSGYAASSDAHWRLGRENGMVDQFVEDSGIPFTVLRPNTFMQNFATSLAGMVTASVIALPEEDAQVSYIDTRDIAACAARLLADSEGHENNFYALTGPEGLSLSQVAEKLGTATGLDVTYAPCSEEAYIETLTTAGVPQWSINMLVSLTRVVKLGMAGNVTQAVEYLTGTPARTFDQFARDYAAAWK